MSADRRATSSIRLTTARLSPAAPNRELGPETNVVTTAAGDGFDPAHDGDRFDRADVVVRHRMWNPRQVAAPIECRGAIAAWTDDGDLHMWVSTQVPHGLRTRIAPMYDLEPHRLHLIAGPFVPCENLLDGAADDCESPASRVDPDNTYPGDGSDCRRSKQFHATIRDVYNPILRDVLAEYRSSGALPNSEYIDISDVEFDSSHVNGGDCFHPSRAGHALLAEKHWCRSQWGAGDPLCKQ